MAAPKVTLPPPVDTPAWFYVYYQQLLYQQQLLQVLLGQVATTERDVAVAGTGFVAAPAGEARVSERGQVVSLALPRLSGTSNAVTFQVTGLPNALLPTRNSHELVRIADNGVDAVGLLVLTNGQAAFDVYASPAGAAFTVGGTKTLYPYTLTYVRG